MNSDFWVILALVCLTASTCISVSEDVRDSRAESRCEESCHPAAGALVEDRCACAAEDGWWQVQP